MKIIKFLFIAATAFLLACEGDTNDMVWISEINSDFAYSQFQGCPSTELRVKLTSLGQGSAETLLDTTVDSGCFSSISNLAIPVDVSDQIQVTYRLQDSEGYILSYEYVGENVGGDKINLDAGLRSFTGNSVTILFKIPD